MTSDQHTRPRGAVPAIGVPISEDERGVPDLASAALRTTRSSLLANSAVCFAHQCGFYPERVAEVRRAPFQASLPVRVTVEVVAVSFDPNTDRLILTGDFNESPPDVAPISSRLQDTWGAVGSNTPTGTVGSQAGLDQDGAAPLAHWADSFGSVSQFGPLLRL